MTQEEIKKLDKKINTIKEPFSTGFPTLRKVFTEMAEKKAINEFDILREYCDWKYKR